MRGPNRPRFDRPSQLIALRLETHQRRSAAIAAQRKFGGVHGIFQRSQPVQDLESVRPLGPGGGEGDIIF